MLSIVPQTCRTMLASFSAQRCNVLGCQAWTYAVFLSLQRQSLLQRSCCSSQQCRRYWQRWQAAKPNNRCKMQLPCLEGKCSSRSPAQTMHCSKLSRAAHTMAPLRRLLALMVLMCNKAKLALCHQYTSARDHTVWFQPCMVLSHEVPVGSVTGAPLPVVRRPPAWASAAASHIPISHQTLRP